MGVLLLPILIEAVVIIPILHTVPDTLYIKKKTSN
jgi:hypothetical protein